MPSGRLADFVSSDLARRKGSFRKIPQGPLASRWLIDRQTLCRPIFDLGQEREVRSVRKKAENIDFAFGKKRVSVVRLQISTPARCPLEAGHAWPEGSIGKPQS